MSGLYWLTDEQMVRHRPYFPNSHGRARVDDRRVLSGIVFLNRNGLRWCDAPKDYGPHKTVQPVEAMGRDGHLPPHDGKAGRRGTEPKTVMIDATYLKAHRTASSLRAKKGVLGTSSVAPKAA